MESILRRPLHYTYYLYGKIARKGVGGISLKGAITFDIFHLLQLILYRL